MLCSTSSTASSYCDQRERSWGARWAGCSYSQRLRAIVLRHWRRRRRSHAWQRQTGAQVLVGTEPYATRRTSAEQRILWRGAASYRWSRMAATPASPLSPQSNYSWRWTRGRALGPGTCTTDAACGTVQAVFSATPLASRRTKRFRADEARVLIAGVVLVAPRIQKDPCVDDVAPAAKVERIFVLRSCRPS